MLTFARNSNSLFTQKFLFVFCIAQHNKCSSIDFGRFHKLQFCHSFLFTEDSPNRFSVYCSTAVICINGFFLKFQTIEWTFIWYFQIISSEKIWTNLIFLAIFIQKQIDKNFSERKIEHHKKGWNDWQNCLWKAVYTHANTNTKQSREIKSNMSNMNVEWQLCVLHETLVSLSLRASRCFPLRYFNERKKREEKKRWFVDVIVFGHVNWMCVCFFSLLLLVTLLSIKWMNLRSHKFIANSIKIDAFSFCWKIFSSQSFFNFSDLSAFGQKHFFLIHDMARYMPIVARQMFVFLPPPEKCSQKLPQTKSWQIRANAKKTQFFFRKKSLDFNLFSINYFIRNTQIGNGIDVVGFKLAGWWTVCSYHFVYHVVFVLMNDISAIVYDFYYIGFQLQNGICRTKNSRNFDIELGHRMFGFELFVVIFPVCELKRCVAYCSLFGLAFVLFSWFLFGFGFIFFSWYTLQIE